MLEAVFGAVWMIVAPASWCWPAPANAIEKTSPCAQSPSSEMLGYFIVGAAMMPSPRQAGVIPERWP
jgi:hypothetical protein